ncbi:MAG: U32 family peptidase [Erysipelotrichaceae bacterium]|nr:U32 family peptidase [Erysipelotrichaceae bacterium]
MEKIELLAPAGDLERLKIAVMYGADAVFLGGKKFSLRSRASNFDIEDIAEGVKFANAYGAKIHVTVNMLPHEEDLEGLKEYLMDLERIGVTAIICASPYIAKTAKTYAPKLEVHISTQHSSTNSAAVAYWKKRGMDRVVLARELTLEDVKETVKHSELPIEVFIHGGMCVAYSGRCVLSNHMTGRDANRGGCAQSCRWKYRLFDKDVALHDEEHLFSMSSKDLMAAKFIPDLIKAGVASLKIEGRMKSAYYIATLIKTYRMLIDEVYEKGSIDESRMQWYYQELSKAENRPTGVGFYEGLPTPFGQLYGINGAGVTQEFIAYVLEYDEQDGTALLEVRNHFAAHSEVEIFGPTITTTSFVIGDLYDKEGEKVEVANKPMQILRTKLPVKAQAHAMIRKVMSKDRSNVY